MSLEPLPPLLTAREFNTTRWSLVLRAGTQDSGNARAALEELFRAYWYPLYSYVRRKGMEPADASDVTQEFFLKLLTNDFTSGLKQEGGRFRSFLLTAFNRFLTNEWKKGQSAKRGGGATPGSLDALILERGEAGYLNELAHLETPETLYQRAWAETLIHRVLEHLDAECASRQDSRFAALRPFLSIEGDPPALADAAAQLNLTLSAFKSLLHRFRQRYRELLIEEVCQTVGTRGEVADEMRGLMQALRRS